MEMDINNRIDFKEIKIDDLELDCRTYNCLRRAGISTLAELCELTEDDLLQIRNLGRKSMEKVITIIKLYENESQKNTNTIDTYSDNNVTVSCNPDKRWERMYNKFSVVWEHAKNDMLSKETGYTKSIYLWGLKQIEEKSILEKWKQDKLNEIGMLWERETYEAIVSPWLVKFNLFKHMYLADDEMLVKEYSIHVIGRFDWAIEEMVSYSEQWKRDKFRNIGISSLYELRKRVSEKKSLLRKDAYHNKIQELNESRLKGENEGIVSIKVIGKRTDYVRHTMVNSIYDCDYYEVSIQICNLFSEEQFKEYVNKNKQRFIECGKQAIIEKRTKKYIKPFYPKLKVDKMVYGLTSHMVTIMFSVRFNENKGKNR